MTYMDKLAAVYAQARRQMQQSFCGVCTVYTLQVRELAGVCCGEDWQPLSDWQDLPCYLALAQNSPALAAADGDGSAVEARFRLFLPPVSEASARAEALPAGSRLRVEQLGQVYWLACSGQPACYPTHMEVMARLLEERA